MPALANPRHEAFAQAIFIGLCSPNIYPTRGHAYNAAGYRAKDAGKAGGSAEVAACNLLKQVKIFDRVRELQTQAAERAQESAHKCVQELNELRRDAHSDKAYGPAVAAVMGKAKILNLSVEQPPSTQLTSPPPTQCRTLDGNCCSPLGLLRLMIRRYRLRLK